MYGFQSLETNKNDKSLGLIGFHSKNKSYGFINCTFYVNLILSENCLYILYFVHVKFNLNLKSEMPQISVCAVFVIEPICNSKLQFSASIIILCTQCKLGEEKIIFMYNTISRSKLANCIHDFCKLAKNDIMSNFNKDLLNQVTDNFHLLYNDKTKLPLAHRSNFKMNIGIKIIFKFCKLASFK